jgi:hypothetical protein
MALIKYIKKYKSYESKEIARRAAKKKKIAPYKSLASKKRPVPKVKKKFNPEAYTKALGNPYGTKFPKAKKVLKKVKKKAKKRRRRKVVVYYN